MGMAFKYRARGWITCWVDLITVLLRLVSFAYISPNWDMDVRAYWARRDFLAYKRAQQRKRT